MTLKMTKILIGSHFANIYVAQMWLVKRMQVPEISTWVNLSDLEDTTICLFILWLFTLTV